MQCLESERLRKNLNGLFVYPMTYDKVGYVSTSVERILTNAKGGLSLPVPFLFLREWILNWGICFVLGKCYKGKWFNTTVNWQYSCKCNNVVRLWPHGN